MRHFSADMSLSSGGVGGGVEVFGPWASIEFVAAGVVVFVAVDAGAVVDVEDGNVDGAVCWVCPNAIGEVKTTVRATIPANK
jgi:hypothetical protein